MKISVRGWGRDQGVIEIVTANLLNAEPVDEGVSHAGKTYFRRDLEGNLAIQLKTKRLELNGNYLLTLHLSDEELARLIKEKFGKRNFSDVAKLLSS